MNTTRQDVYKAIDTERDYQGKNWQSGNLSVAGEITLLRYYLRQFEDHYQQEDDDLRLRVPITCMDDVRKMAGILVRCMENHIAPERK
jgi:hypothetical protein